MKNPCPPPGTLSAYQAGLLEEAPREALESHAGTCPACQEALLLLGAAGQAPQDPPLPETVYARLESLRPATGSPFRFWRAAAAVLLAALGFWLLPAKSPPPRGEAGSDHPKSPAGGEARSFPRGRLDAGRESRAFLASGAELLLEPGARAACEAGSRGLRLEGGTCWLEVTRGEAAALRLPRGELVLERGLAKVTLAALPQAVSWHWLLGEAQAEETSQATVWVMEGEATIREGGRVLRTGPGRRLSLTSRGWQEAPCTPEESEGLWEARSAAAAALAGRALLPAGSRLDGNAPRLQAEGSFPAAYRWVTVLQERSAATEVRFVLPADGTWHSWTAALAGRSPAPREVVEVVWDGEFLRGRLNGRPVFSVGRESLAGTFTPVARGGAWGISVWGGSVTVEKSVLEEAR